MTARPMRPRSALPDLSALFDVEDDEEDPAFMDGKALPRPARRALRALSQGAGNKKERSSRRCRQQLLSAADFFLHHHPGRRRAAVTVASPRALTASSASRRRHRDKESLSCMSSS